MASANKQGKMINYLGYQMRATLKDGRQLVGQMLAFDKFMNLVLADCEEFRKVKRKTKAAAAPGATASTSVVETEEKRMLGLVILRGAHVVSCSVDGPPPADPSARLGTSAPGGPVSTLQAGPGISKPAGRGAGIGLQGPAAGIGGPSYPGAPGFAGGLPPGFAGRGGPPPGFPPMGFPPGFQPPPGGRGFPPPPGAFPGR